MCNCPDPETVNRGAPFGEVALGGGWTLADVASLGFIVWIGLQLVERLGGARGTRR